MRRPFIVSVLACAVFSSVSFAYDWSTNPGDGSQINPYQISEPNHLMAIGFTAPLLSRHFVLVNDIIFDPNNPDHQFTAALIAPDTSAASGFQGNPFIGAFDGGGFGVYSLKIDGGFYLGLFGNIGEGGRVFNLLLRDVQIIGTGSKVGGLCGYNYYGSIRDCSVAGSVTGLNETGGLCGYNDFGILIHCSAEGRVSGSYSTGGLCGYNWGYIAGCRSSADISGQLTLGGLVGNNRGHAGTILSCMASGSVSGDQYLGGLCANNEGNIANCAAVGPIDGTDTLGGLCGRSSGIIISSWSAGAVTGTGSFVEGFCGSDSAANIRRSFWDVDASGIGTSGDNIYGAVGKTTAQMQDPAAFLEAGWDFIHERTNGTNDFWIPPDADYPQPAVFDPAVSAYLFSGQGIASDPYLIADANDLGAVWQQADQCFRLTNDIDLDGITWRTAPIPFLSGSLNGDEYTIGSLTIGDTRYLGLVGNILKGHIVDLNLDNVAIMATGDYAGGLCGLMSIDSTIEACSVSGTVNGVKRTGGLCGLSAGSIEKSFTQGVVTGTDYVGGLCGYVTGGEITGCLSTCSVQGQSYAGGLLGFSAGFVRNTYASGPVSGQAYLGGLCGRSSGGIFMNSYAAGLIPGGDCNGGFLGYLSGGSVAGCFWDVQTSGIGAGGQDNYGAVGKTTAQMQTLTTFTNWDFVTIWSICEGTNYPRFLWRISPGDLTCPDGVGMEDLSAFGQCWQAAVHLAGELEDDEDQVISLPELAQVARYWLQVGCGDCGGMDLTCQGDVTLDDLTALACNWLSKQHPECSIADMNGDDIINLTDLQEWVGFWMHK